MSYRVVELSSVRDIEYLIYRAVFKLSRYVESTLNLNIQRNDNFGTSIYVYASSISSPLTSLHLTVLDFVAIGLYMLTNMFCLQSVRW